MNVKKQNKNRQGILFSFKTGMAIVCMLLVCMTSCKKDDDNGNSNGNDNPGVGSNKFSPPAWIQGSWGEKDEEDEEGIELLKFTSNDIIMSGFSWTTIFQSTLVYTVKETNTNTLYEVTVRQKNYGTETGAVMLSIKKGDGTYIEAAFVEDDETITQDDYVILHKL